MISGGKRCNVRNQAPWGRTQRLARGCAVFLLLSCCSFTRLALGSVEATMPQTDSDLPRCVPLDVSECESILPYPHGMLANPVNSQERQSVLSPYRPLLDATDVCSPYLLFVLCSLHAPPCTSPGSQATLPPCRGICRHASTDCRLELTSFNISWPQQLNCGQLPTRHMAKCLRPDDKTLDRPLTSNTRPAHQGRSSKKKATLKPLKITKKGCKCRKSSTKLSRRVYVDRRFSFAVKALFIATQGIDGGPVIITIYVQDVLKTASVRIPSNTNLTLWAGRGCVCPSFKNNHPYLLLGFEDRSHSRLLFDDYCIAVRWSEKWKERIPKWEMRNKRSRQRKPSTRLGSVSRAHDRAEPPRAEPVPVQPPESFVTAPATKRERKKSRLLKGEENTKQQGHENPKPSKINTEEVNLAEEDDSDTRKRKRPKTPRVKSSSPKTTSKKRQPQHRNRGLSTKRKVSSKRSRQRRLPAGSLQSDHR